MSEEIFHPDEAADRIHRAGDAVRTGRRHRATVSTSAGVAMLAYFVLFGTVRRGHTPALTEIVLTLAPTVAVLMGVELWRRRPSVEGRRLSILESRAIAASSVFACVAGIGAVTLPHPIPSTLCGLLPAAPWFLLAWRTARA